MIELVVWKIVFLFIHDWHNVVWKYAWSSNRIIQGVINAKVWCKLPFWLALLDRVGWCVQGLDLVIELRCSATWCSGWSETEVMRNWVHWFCWWKGSWNWESWWCCSREGWYWGGGNLAMCLPRPVGDSFWRIYAHSLCSFL